MVVTRLGMAPGNTATVIAIEECVFDAIGIIKTKHKLSLAVPLQLPCHKVKSVISRYVIALTAADWLQNRNLRITKLER